MESSSLHQLQQIPGVGKTIARNMQNIGIDDLNGRQPEPLVLYFSDFNTTCFNWWRVTAHVQAKAAGSGNFGRYTQYNMRCTRFIVGNFWIR